MQDFPDDDAGAQKHSGKARSDTGYPRRTGDVRLNTEEADPCSVEQQWDLKQSWTFLGQCSRGLRIRGSWHRAASEASWGVWMLTSKHSLSTLLGLLGLCLACAGLIAFIGIYECSSGQPRAFSSRFLLPEHIFTLAQEKCQPCSNV